MRFFIPFGATFLILSVALAANDEDNAAEFREMCNFIKLLKKSPTERKVKIGRSLIQIPDAAAKQLKQLIILNASTTDEATYRTLTKGEPLEALDDKKSVQQVAPESGKGLLEFSKTDRDEIEKRRKQIAGSPKRISIHRQIGKILESGEEIYRQVQGIEAEIKQTSQSAREAMLSAAFGRQVVTEKGVGGASVGGDPYETIDAASKSFDVNGATGTTGLYARQCGGSTATAVGISIAADITCLCATTASPSGSQTLCDSGITLGTPSAFDSNDDAVAVWGRVKTVCLGGDSAGIEDLQPSSETLHGIVERHRALLGKNAIHINAVATTGTGSKHSLFILGKHAHHASSAPTCDGTAVTASTQHGTCVNYQAVLSKGKQITWVTEVQQAAKLLEELDGFYRDELDQLNKLTNLRITAEAIFASGEATDSSTTETGPASPGSTTASTQKDVQTIPEGKNQNGDPSKTSAMHPQRLAYVILVISFL